MTGLVFLPLTGSTCPLLVLETKRHSLPSLGKAFKFLVRYCQFTAILLCRSAAKWQGCFREIVQLSPQSF